MASISISARLWASLLGCLLCFCGSMCVSIMISMCKPQGGSESSPFQLDQHDWISARLIKVQ